ncbi:anthranilate phosphoribosyltransferase [bacterium]|nr:anthranilate phosphoribosyltransferase [bacterium]
MIKESINKLVEQKNLSEAEIQEVMQEIMEGKATSAQIAAFITALRIKGETVEEITGCAKVMRAKAQKINVDGKTIVDTCGTGGDKKGTFNISTATAFVVAGAEESLAVAKHGNRSVSSHCGSADVLQFLGVKVDASPAIVEKCVNEIGIGFFFAPIFHESMKYAIGPRREIGIRTVFNILGPLTNPANAQAQVLGVYSSSLTEPMAKVLGKLGVKQAFVVYGVDGLDEVTTTGDTMVSELKDGQVSTFYIQPENFDLPRAKLSDLQGGSIEENAQILLDVLKGKEGHPLNIVVLNAAVAITAGKQKKADNVAEKIRLIKESVDLARKSIDSGSALQKLELLKEYTNS